MREVTTLKLKRKVLGATLASSKYRVYTTSKEFVTLEARTASEACKVSGIKRPYRIVRLTPNAMRLLDKEVMDVAAESVFETSPMELEETEGEERKAPIIIPAPRTRGTRIIDDLDITGYGGGFTQVPLASMGKKSQEDAVAMQEIAKQIVADSTAETGAKVEKAVIITPDMLTIEDGALKKITEIEPPLAPVPVAAAPAAPPAAVEVATPAAAVTTPAPPVAGAEPDYSSMSPEEAYIRQTIADTEKAMADPKPSSLIPEGTTDNKELSPEEIAKLLGDS